MKKSFFKVLMFLVFISNFIFFFINSILAIGLSQIDAQIQEIMTKLTILASVFVIWILLLFLLTIVFIFNKKRREKIAFWLIFILWLGFIAQGFLVFSLQQKISSLTSINIQGSIKEVVEPMENISLTKAQEDCLLSLFSPQEIEELKKGNREVIKGKELESIKCLSR